MSQPLPLRLYLFGPFRATWSDETPLDLRSRKVQGLIAWLVLESRQPTPRNQIADLLWPGYLPTSALQSLRTLLYSLRQQLDPLDLLKTTNRTLHLDMENADIWCDVMAVERILAELQPVLSTDAPLSAVQRAAASEALALCSGDFMQDLIFDDSPAFEAWLHQRRAHYRQQAERLHTALQRKGESEAQPIATVDWGEIPSPVALYGREEEGAQIERWLHVAGTRLIGIYGIGGQGKTSLAAAAVRSEVQRADRPEAERPGRSFQRIIWRSLLNAPLLDEILLDWIRFLSDYAISQLPSSLDRKIALLLDLLRARPCLLVLDNLESILESGARAGRFRPGYEAYAQVINRLAQGEHASCLLITSREQPIELERLSQVLPAVQALALAGLSAAAGMTMLHRRQIQGSLHSLDALTAHYSGNPLALLLVAQMVKDLFRGNADSFLAQDRLIFEDIRDVLEAQIRRLSPLEFDLLLWLAIEREPVSMAELHANLLGYRERTAVIDALRSLRRRLLVESYAETETGVLFGLQNVVLEYLTDWLVTTTCHELEEGELHVLRSHTLIKAQTRDYVRQSQLRLILKPTAAQLTKLWGQGHVGVRLRPLLDQLRQETPLKMGYAAANLLHLQAETGTLDAADFSHLSIPSAYLRHAQLPQVNFAGADLSGSVFTDTIGVILAVAADPTDTYIAACTEDGRIWIWRKADQSLHQLIQTDASYLFGIDFSPDGRLLASSGVGGALHLWEVASGRLHMRLTLADSPVKAVAFSPDGAWLASSGVEGAVNLWRLSTGELEAVLDEHQEAVIALCFTQDGRLLVCADASSHISLWDWQQRTLVSCWREDPGVLLMALDAHPGEDWVACAHGDGVLCVRSWPDGGLLHRLESGGVLYDVVFSHDGKLILGACHDGLIYIWETESGQRVNLLGGHAHRVLALALCVDGRTLISGGADQSVRVWDLISGRCLYEFSGHRRSIAALSLNPKADQLAVAGSDFKVWLWQTQNWQVSCQWPAHHRLITTCAFAPNGQMLATGSSDHIIHLWETATGERLRSLSGHNQPVERVAFHPSLPLLASGGLDCTLRLWDVESGQQVAVRMAHTSWISDLAFSPDGSLLVSSGGDRMIRFWALDDNLALQSVAEYGVEDVDMGIGIILAFHPSGRFLAHSQDGAVDLLDIHARQRLHRFVNPSAWITALAFNDDGSTLVCAGFERILRLWDIASGRLQWQYVSLNKVNSLRFSASGTHLYSGRADGFIDVLDAQTGICLRSVQIPGPYEGMNIRGVTGISAAQRASLLALGAVER